MKKSILIPSLLLLSASLFADAEDIFRTFGVHFGDNISEYKTLPDDRNVPALRVQPKTQSEIFPDGSRLYLYDDGEGKVEGFLAIIEHFPDLVIKYPSGDRFLNNPKNERIEYLFRETNKSRDLTDTFFDEERNLFYYHQDMEGNYYIYGFIHDRAPVYDDAEIIE
jgi:hypothetical protein